MRGKKYQALIVAILLLTSLPYSPFLSRASSIEDLENLENDGTPPFRDSDGDGLSDDYEISLGFDPNDFDMDDDGISDMMEMDFWNDLVNEDFIPPNMEDLYDCEGDLDGDGITNCMDPDADGDGIPDMEEMADMDLDGIPDMYENMIDHLDPNNPDSDGDGIPDMEDDDPPLPPWAEEMATNNGWTPQPDANGMSGALEGFYPLAMLAAVKFTVSCDSCEETTANPQYWRTAAKDIYDNGYDSITDTYSRSQWCPAPGCELYDIESGIIENPGYWSTGNTPYTYDYLITNPEVTSEQHTYTMTWIMPVQGYLSTALHTNSVFISNSVTMDSAFNLKIDGYAQSYTFTMTEYYIPDSAKQNANAPDSFSPQLTELPNFPSRPGPNNDVYDLAASITEGKTSDFEKAEAIMYYLRNNYYYNINGTLTPDGDDYVDYFLFGNPGQDGKCTNFASAFTVLSRLNNIPTRYVEGNGGGSVVTPEEWESSGYGSSTGYTIEEDTRVVTMLNGHAYAEVLFDGIGWITFEPTSSNTCPTCDSNTAGTTGEDDTVEGNGTQPGTDYEINDSDGDGLSDEYEESIGTNPFNMDTDGDSLPDGAETNTGEYKDVEDTGTSPLTSDTDNDGLEDDDEILCRLYTPLSGKFCSHPLDSDSDNDGLTDGDEYYIYETNPVDNDADKDGLVDGLELGISLNDIWEDIEHNLVPCETKTGGIMTNCQETWQPDEDPNSTTDPFNVDTDGDGIEDGIEDSNHNGKLDLTNDDEDPCNDETDPTLADTDEGGRNDFEECEIDSTNPRDPTDDIRDSDGDGIFDHIEDGNCIYGTAQNKCTNATALDTDEDGVNDFDEIFNCFYGKNNDQCTDPTLEDTDGDTLLDNEEITNCIYGENNDECTDPTLFDTDEGGANDVLEIFGDFTDPLNKTDDIQQADRDDDEDGLKNIEEDKNGNGIFEPELGETDSQDNDTDDDGLEDGDEIFRNTNPLNTDSDGDDLTDGEEVYNTTWGPTNATNADTDDDGLEDGEEVLGYGTDPNVKDSDSDGINDGEEVEDCLYGEDGKSCTNPANDDSDFDGIDDGEEINTRYTDPMDSDTDDDGVDDGVELSNCTYGSDGEQCTDPLLWDSDGDGIDDFTEINDCIYGEDNDECTDPTTDDSDNDGLEDWSEINNNTWGPTDPLNSDTDGGGQKDGLEVLVDGTDPNDGSDDDLSAFDNDNDGLTNGEEEGIYFTDPNDSDTDNDGLKDGDEVNNWTSDPNKKDSDYDGIEDGNETINCIYGEEEDECTSPIDDDSDNDGLEDGDEVNNWTSDPKKADTDDDGLTDSTEVNNCIYGEANDECTNPISEDSDGDNVTDGDEIGTYFTNPMDIDSDNDNIDDYDEINNCLYGETGTECTNPNIADSDGDSIIDGNEVRYLFSDPMDTDTDDDEINDGIENSNCIYGVDGELCTDLTNDDSDFDGVNDWDEIFNCVYGENSDECTDPIDWDSENDGVSDGSEINTYLSNPLIEDTDDDGLDDGEELNLGTNLTNSDTDDDSLSDYVEVNNCIYGQNNTGSDCTDPTSSDSDSDGINDWLEITLTGTDPMDDDSDGDRLSDGQEIAGQDRNGTSHGHGATDPLDADSDNGGIRDGTEIETDDTNPNNPSDDFLAALDNDGDGLSNGEEITEGTDPNDPDSDDDGLSDGDEVYGLNNTYGYTSDPNEPDSDADGLNDSAEISNCIYGDNEDECTNPENDDSDFDGIDDGEEISNCIYGENDDECTDPKILDSDDDDISDGSELNYLTDPKDSDSDDDGLLDSWEVYDHYYNLQTDPNDSDSDDDGLSDYDEFIIHLTDPNDSDSDDDGLTDYDEVSNCIYGENDDECTDPNELDSDGDGLNDYNEINTYNTDPKDSDSDGDGLNDGLEISLESNPLSNDSDGDELNDLWEWVRTTQGYPYDLTTNDTNENGVLDGDEDLDNDGLGNLDEMQGNNADNYITDPLKQDTDNDGLYDGDEIDPWNIKKDAVNNQYNYPSDPTKIDSDDDLLSDYEEVRESNDTYNSRTNPKKADTDNDGLNDYEEVTYYWNTTSNNATYLVYYNVSGNIEGWQTSDSREENTDGDAWEDGDGDEVNPVYGYYEEEDPPWGSPPSRAGTPEWPPTEVFKDEVFIWSFYMINATSEEPYVGLQIDAYINETEELGGASHKIGTGISDSDGFMEIVCNGSSLASTIKAGNWFLQLHREEQFLMHDNASKRIKEEWRDAVPLNLTIIGNSTIELDIPEDFTGASGQTAIVTGKLFEDNNIPIQDTTIDLVVQNIGTYSQTTNEDGSFAITIDLPETDEEEIVALFFEYSGNENITETAITDAIRVINASVVFVFDENNAKTLELNQTYTIRGGIAGDEMQEPTGKIEIDYSGIILGEIVVTGNQVWELNVTIPENSSWGEGILKATYSGDSFHPASIIISEVIVKGGSEITLEEIENLRTQNIKFEGNLTDHNGNPISEYTVNLYFNDDIIGSAVTNSEGRYSFSDKDFSQELPGIHSISARLLESESLYGDIANTNLTLLATPSIIFDIETKCQNDSDENWLCKTKRNSDYEISGVLIDELEVPLSGITITFFRDDLGYLEQTTNELGQFQFLTPINDEEIEIELEIEDNDITDTLKNELLVIPQHETVITLKVNNAHRGDNVTVEGSIMDKDGAPVISENVMISISGNNYYTNTDANGNFALNHTLVSNYELGEDIAFVIFNETTYYLSNQTNSTFEVYGSSYFDNIRVEGDWFNQRIVRGGEIIVTGILVDDLGNRLTSNISSTIGSKSLNNATFTNDTTFVITGNVPEIYRNNHTLQLNYLGSEFILGASYKSQENILVPTIINFDFEPSTVFAGDNVNVSIWLEEDDQSALPDAQINVSLKKYFNKGKIQLEKETTMSLVTDSNGFTEFSFVFPANGTSVSIEIEFEGGYLNAFYDTPKETEFTEANIAISITKAAEPIEPFDFDKYIPLFIGIPAALLVTGYYMYWTQKHKYEVRNLIKQMQKELNKDEDYRQIIIKSYHQLLNILSRYGFIKTRTQTVREFTDVMARALPIPEYSVKLLTSLFEIARYSGIKPKVVDEFGMEMIDGSYNIWCVEAINSLHQVEVDLNAGLKKGKVSRFTNVFGMGGNK